VPRQCPREAEGRGIKESVSVPPRVQKSVPSPPSSQRRVIPAEAHPQLARVARPSGELAPATHQPWGVVFSVLSVDWSKESL
jgi:hypothetical protein